jgi:hypothetical protein
VARLWAGEAMGGKVGKTSSPCLASQWENWMGDGGWAKNERKGAMLVPGLEE